MKVRHALFMASMLAGVTTASAQPGNPAPTAASEDPVLAEQIAASLVARGYELFDAKIYLEAKQLANEALMRSPSGAAAEQAKVLIKAVNTALGIVDPQDKPVEKVDLTPIRDPLADQPKPVEPVAEGNRAARPRTIISGVVWGGAAGGLFADAVKVDGTKASHIAIGAGVGAAIGGLGGMAISRKAKLTRGDVALMDTLAGIGGIGGFTVGMLMQPVESEAYSVNSIIGIASGLLIGYIAAPQTNTTERRMLRVAGISLGAGAVPFLLYAGIYDKTTKSDERIVGALSTAGLLGGAFIGFRLTRNMDVGQDVLPGEKNTEDAPVAIIGRDSNGRWRPNGVAITPTSPLLSPQPGLTVNVLGGSF